jgi:hypothetical protein
VWRYTCADDAGYWLARPAPVTHPPLCPRGQSPVLVVQQRFGREESLFSSTKATRTLLKPDEPYATCDQIVITHLSEVF